MLSITEIKGSFIYIAGFRLGVICGTIAVEIKATLLIRRRLPLKAAVVTSNYSLDIDTFLLL